MITKVYLNLKQEHNKYYATYKVILWAKFAKGANCICQRLSFYFELLSLLSIYGSLVIFGHIVARRNSVKPIWYCRLQTTVTDKSKVQATWSEPLLSNQFERNERDIKNNNTNHYLHAKQYRFYFRKNP